MTASDPKRTQPEFDHGTILRLVHSANCPPTLRSERRLFYTGEEETMKKLAIALVLASLTSLAACKGDTDAALKALDPDNDGTIDLAEAQAGGEKIFAKINPDNDGTVDEKELSGRLDAAGLKAADPDNDGTLDVKEYAAVVEKKFKAANPDNDGTIDKKELESPAGQDLLKLIY
jgi:Ca2+-binding EF-hand superfamily protein